jgi:hypothetical protein
MAKVFAAEHGRVSQEFFMSSCVVKPKFIEADEEPVLVERSRLHRLARGCLRAFAGSG